MIAIAEAKYVFDEGTPAWLDPARASSERVAWRWEWSGLRPRRGRTAVVAIFQIAPSLLPGNSTRKTRPCASWLRFVVLHPNNN
jgi:hypothetical protein